MERLKKVLWFKGRINRLEYSISVFLTWPFAYWISDFYLGDPPVWLILAILYTYFTQGAKRCQDREVYGFWIFWPINFLWNFSDKGTIGDNKYGIPPKGIFFKLN